MGERDRARRRWQQGQCGRLNGARRRSKLSTPTGEDEDDCGSCFAQIARQGPQIGVGVGKDRPGNHWSGFADATG